MGKKSRQILEAVKIVVDTNIAFSAILRTDSKIADLLMKSANFFEFFTCQMLRQEIHNHRERLMKISGLTENEFEKTRDFIFSKLRFISEEQIPFDFWQNALPLVREVDMDDIAFVALNNFLNADLWSGDKELLHHLKYKKGYARCLTTRELFDLREQLRQANN